MTQTLAQVDTVGDRFRVNATLPSGQDVSSVAALASGNFIAVWRENNGNFAGPFEQNIRAQIVGADGSRIGPEIHVNAVLGQNQQAPIVAGLSGGGFVVTWYSADTNLVYAQVFDPAGAKVGGEIVEPHGGSYGGEAWPKATGLADGGFALIWRSHVDLAANPNGDYEVRLQLFNADSTARGGIITVNSADTGFGGSLSYMDGPTITTLQDGRLLATWTDKSHSLADQSGSGLYGQFLTSAGVKVGSPFLLNGSTNGDQLNPAVVPLTGGGFAMTWNDNSYVWGRAQAFDSSGQRVGGEIWVPYNDVATALPGNRFLLESISYPQLTLSVYDASGTFITGSQLTVDFQGPLTANADGQILLAWTKYTDSANPADVIGQMAVIGEHGTAGNDNISGTSGADYLYAETGNDVVDAQQGGNDTIVAGAGDDYLYFGAALTAADKVDGGAGTDTLALLGTYNLTLGANTLSGIETLSLLSGTAAGGSAHVTYSITTVDENVAAGARLTVYAGGLLSDESLLFDGHAETDGALSVYGGAGNDLIAGGPAADAFVGGAGDDQLYGLGGNDWLEGGLGADLLRGGFGSDLFVYKSASDSTAAATDHIVDFEDQVDLINLQSVDANSTLAGDQAFSFIGQDAFSGAAGELRIEGSGSNWFVQGDTDGDGLADLVIQVDTFRGYALQATNFML